MKLNRWISLCLGVGLFSMIVFVAVRAAPSADENKPEPRGRGDDIFAGKILAVYEKTSSREGGGYLIEDAFIVDLNGKPVLAGKCVRREEDWTSGLKLYIPWDNIGSIVEGDNIEAFNEKKVL